MLKAECGIVLAGGASSRMGRDKASLRTPDGMSWLARALSVLSTTCRPEGLLIVSGREGADPVFVEAARAMHRRGVRQDVLAVPDLRGGRGGPVEGLVSALSVAGARMQAQDVALVLAVDQPRVEPGDLELLAAVVQKEPWAAASFGEERLPLAISKTSHILQQASSLMQRSNPHSLHSLLALLNHTAIQAGPEVVERLRNFNSPLDMGDA